MRRLFQWIAHKRNDNKVFTPVLVGTSLVAGAISLWIGLRQSVWFDEAYSILVAKQPLGNLIHLVSLDTHPPLYYVVLKLWAGLFGWSELSLRSLSVAAFVAALIVAGLLLRKMFGVRVAIGAMLLVMVSPLLLRYGFEIRMYSLGILIGVSATYALYSAWRSGSRQDRDRWLTAYGLLVVIGMFTLYPLALLWIAHVVWISCVHWGKKAAWNKLLPYVLAYVGAVVLFLPWLPTFFNQLSNGALAPIGQPVNLENIIGILTFNSVYNPTWGLSVVASAAVIASGIAVGYLATISKRALSHHRPEVLLLAAYITVPVIVLMIVSLKSSMYVERYLAHVALGLVMLIGVVVTTGLIQGRGRMPVGAAVIVYATLLAGTLNVSLLGNYNFQRMQAMTVRQAAADARKSCGTDKLLLAADPYVATEFAYYLPPDCTMYFVSQWDTLGGGYAPFSGSKLQIKHTDQLTRTDVVYIYYGNPDQVLPGEYKQTSDRTYGALHVTNFSR